MGRLFDQVEGVVAEAIDVLGQIRADCGDGILGNGLAALFEGLIVKNQAICDRVVLFDGLPLFVAAVFHDDPVASEEGPLEEAIGGLALSWFALDRQNWSRQPLVATSYSPATGRTKRLSYICMTTRQPRRTR